ncbi:MAG TPA: hypothetical protein VGG89_14265 [Candidatus Baltobacteraceae bacterium]|jgi:hypothetical protein
MTAGISTAGLLKIKTATGFSIAMPLAMSLVEDAVFERLRGELPSAPAYKEEVAVRFDYLLVALIRFLYSRMHTDSEIQPYLAAFGDGTAPVEGKLENDLYLALSMIFRSDIQRRAVSAGRTDIVIREHNFNFVIEVKRTFDEWSIAVPGFLGQTTAYQQADVKIGVLSILDLTERDAGVPGFEYCFEVHERTIPNESGRWALVMRVPGNRTLPSKMSKPRAPATKSRRRKSQSG